MKKGPACMGCPFYDSSTHYVPDEIREGAPVYVMGQNPGGKEEALGRPFVGKTGQDMEGKYLKDAGLTREDVSLGNAIRCRLNGKDDLPQLNDKRLKEALAHCTREHLRLPAGTRLVVAQGDYASVACTGEPVGGWRGYLRPFLGRWPVDYVEPWVPQPADLPVLVTSHLARLYRDPTLVLPTRMDWAKVPRILRRGWPRRPPRWQIGPRLDWPERSAFDTEYDRHDPSQLTRYSMAWGVEDDQSCVVEASEHRDPTWTGRPIVITQYAPADVAHLAQLTRTRWQDSVWQQFQIEDTVWKHAVLWSEHPHDLNYLASLYSSFNRWKHLADTSPHLYSALDAVGLYEIDLALERGLDADPLSRTVWETIDRPALGEFVRAQYHGIRTDPHRVNQVMDLLSHEVAEAEAAGRAMTGMFTFNIGSSAQVAHRLYQVEGIKEPR